MGEKMGEILGERNRFMVNFNAKLKHPRMSWYLHVGSPQFLCIGPSGFNESGQYRELCDASVDIDRFMRCDSDGRKYAGIHHAYEVLKRFGFERVAIELQIPFQG